MSDLASTPAEWTQLDERFMQAALDQAELALDTGEVPVGCVFVHNGEVISTGYNATNVSRNGTRHAEIIAFEKILEQHGSTEAQQILQECDLYVTCEPCIMCAGALSLLKVKSVIYGCPNDKFGGNGSIVPVNDLGCGGCSPLLVDGGSDGAAHRKLGATYPSRGGLCAEQAVSLLQDFYIAGNPHAPKPHRPLKMSRSRREGRSHDGAAADEAGGAGIL